MFNEVIEGFKLSPPQDHLWQMQQTVISMPVHAQCAILIEGKLDFNLLKSALHEVVSRYDILRTSFESLPGMAVPLQVIRDDSPRMEEEIYMGEMNQDLVEGWIEAELKVMSEESCGKEVVKAKLIVLDQRKHLLLVSMPALCTDGEGLKNLIKAISRSYASILQEEPLDDDDAIQYSVISEWLNELLESEQAEAGRDYWRTHDLTSPTFSGIPYQSRNSITAQGQLKVFSGTLSHESLVKIESVSRQRSATVSEFLMACWHILLWRITGQTKITTGVAYDGRTDEDLEQMLGLFAKYLPIQTQLKQGIRFDDVLKQVTESAREANEWQECFSWRYIPALVDMHQPMLFAFGFEFEVWPPTISAGNVEFSLYRKFVPLDRSVIKLCCIQKQDQLVTEFHYDSALLDEGQIRRLAGEFHTLIESALDAPKGRIDELNLLNEIEQETLFQFNSTDVDLPPDCIHNLFERQVRHTPDTIAVVFDDQQLTFAELSTRSDSLAHYLRSIGVKPGLIVAICMERSIEMAVGLLGILKAGGAYLPLDPNYPEQRLSFMLEESQGTILLSQRHLAPNLSEHDVKVVYLDEDLPTPTSDSKENEKTETTPGHLAYVIYTSGSTGNPKGVMISHASICNRLLWMQKAFPVTANDRILQKTAFSFDASVWEIFIPLITGAQLVMAAPGGHKDASYMIEMIVRHQITTLQLIPSMLQLLLDRPGMESCRSLKRVFCGGEVLPAGLPGRFFNLLNCDLHNLYGPTEVSIDATCWVCEPGYSESFVTIGRAIANMKIYMQDKNLQLTPIGVPGECYIGGIGLAYGYLNRPGLTAERFIPDPLGNRPGARLYRTGDLARYLDDGNIEFLGRLDRQIKLRGFRIEPGEIESAICSHPEIRDSVVTVIEDSTEDKRLVAYIVTDRGQHLSNDELHTFLRTRLPEHMTLSVIVWLDALPLLPNGKVDRSALPSPMKSIDESDGPFVAPRNLVELKLAQIWEEVLAIQPISVKSNFFILGGHSMLAISLVTRIEQRFGKNLPLAALFEAPTIAQLSALLHEEEKGLLQHSLVEIRKGENRLPLFCVHPIGGEVLCYYDLARILGPEQPVYGLQSVRTDGERRPMTRIEEMAVHYIKEIKTVQPDGPYNLFGWSLGGTVAFEMARQLQAQGEEIGILALADSIAFDNEDDQPEVDETELLAEFLETFGGQISEIRKLDKQRQYEYALEQVKKYKWLREDLSLEEVKPYWDIYTNNMQALKRYRPKEYDGEIVLLKAAERGAGPPRSEALGWENLVRGGVRSYEIGGVHSTMMQQPTVQKVAAQIKSLLEAVSLRKNIPERQVHGCEKMWEIPSEGCGHDPA
jgi:amino acid adenylation domain-containing protein